MIRLENVERRFGAQTLFEGLSWLVPASARIGLVGPNGAGKTTLLRLIAGDDQPTQGRVHRPRDLRVAFLPQQVESVADGTVLEVAMAGAERLLALERLQADLADELSRVDPTDPRSTRLRESWADARARFEAGGGDQLETRARRILSGLGLTEDSFGSGIATLSGGWRMRVILARLLLGDPDLLLLDEPTNHLDLEAIAWLERFLADHDGAFLMVSHDRYFLNRSVNAIFELESGHLTGYPGNYDAYVEARAARRAAQEKARQHQNREIAKVERFIERFRYKASKARQVQSRLRALDKIDLITSPESSKRVRFGLQPAPRSGDLVVRIEGLTKRFGDRVVWEGADLLLRRGDRVALLGPNGSGKSTLIKMILGALAPDAGRVEIGHKVAMQYFAQHQLDALDPQATVLETLERMATPGEAARLRSILGAFLFSGDAVDKRVAVLSGGEKARLALARMLLEPANLLLLDEPTNHLDLGSREVLEDALDEYEGTLVAISHDRYFINRVATSVAWAEAGRIVHEVGDYDSYLDRLQAPGPAIDAPAADSRASRESLREQRRREADERNARFRERQAVEAVLAPIESEIAELEQECRAIELAQTNPDVYSDPVRAAEVARAKSVATARLETLYADWTRLASDSSS